MRRPRLLSEVSHCIRTVDRLDWLIRLNITPHTKYIIRMRDNISLGSCVGKRSKRTHTLTHVCSNLDYMRGFMTTIDIIEHIMSKGSL